MSKRFTDSEKWKKQFFKRLTQGQMLFWNFINDDCDHAGIWYVDLEVCALRIKEQVDIEKIVSVFNEDEERVILFDRGKKLLIKAFMPFQYGENLGDKNRLHQAALETLRKHGYEYFKGVITPLEQVKGKVKGKVMEKEEELEKPNHDPKFNQLEAFEEIWELYPAKGRLKRSASLRIWCEIAVSRDIASRVQKSIKNYTEHLKANDWKNPQEFPNWLPNWPEWERHKEHSEKREQKPSPSCGACEGKGQLPDNAGKCWCWS